MSTKDVVFIRQQGGLGRTAPGEDYISAFISYGSLEGVLNTEEIDPSDDNNTKKKLVTAIFSLKQAEDLGIIPNDLKVNTEEEIVAKAAVLGDDPDTKDVVEEAAVAVLPEGKIGIHNIWHYHISEYFRINPSGQLWLGLYEVDSDPDTDDAEVVDGQGNILGGNLDTADGSLVIAYNEVLEVQRAANGKIRQAAVYTTNEFSRGLLGTLQDNADVLEEEHMPLSILLGADVSAIDNFVDEGIEINNGSEKNVSFVIGQDGGNLGAELFGKHEVSISCLGAALGAVSTASVHESIAWVQEFNVASLELDTLALANGTTINSLARTQIDAIDNMGYIFLKKHIGISGSYFNDTHTGAMATNDFAFIENNRTLDKAIRGIRTALLPQLSSPLYVEDNGNLSFDTIGYFESLAGKPLEAMRIDGEVSNYDVFIDSEQDVLGSSELKIQVSVIPVGVARRIEVSIGFTLSIA